MEVHLGETTFTKAGLEGHHLKQVIQLSVTSIGATRPNVPTNISWEVNWTILLLKYSAKIFHFHLIKPLEPLYVVYKKIDFYS